MIQFDNVRGKFDSRHLEAFMTADGKFSARIPYGGYVSVDPDGFIILMTSNGVEMPRDLANRSLITRIRKRPRDYVYREYSEGDLLDHIRANQPHILACVFAIVKEWLDAGRPKTKEARHDFRPYCQALDWIVQEVLGEAPLLDDHEGAQQRVADSGLGFVRSLAIAVSQAGQCGRPLTATALANIASDAGIGLSTDATHDESKGAKKIGFQLSRVFRGVAGKFVEIDGFQIRRIEHVVARPDGKGSFVQKRFVFADAKTNSTPGHSSNTPQPQQVV